MARTQGSRAEITGPLIRDHALRLFARHGYAAVSMRQIAAEVGVQAGTIYAYTPDKQALLADLLTDHMEQLLMAWADDPAQPPLARLEGFVRFHIRFSLDHPDAVFLSYMELRNLTPENFAAITRLRRHYEGSLQDILFAGQSDGVMQRPRHPADGDGADRDADRRHELVSRRRAAGPRPRDGVLLGTGARRGRGVTSRRFAVLPQRAPGPMIAP